MGESTPGPGAYDGGKMMRTGKLGALSAMDTGERMPMSSFKSKSLQRPKKKETENVPGASAYSPQFTALEKGKTNPGASMRAKGARSRRQQLGESTGGRAGISLVQIESSARATSRRSPA